MSRVLRFVPTPSRRLTALALAIGVALLIAAALIVDTPARTTGGMSGDDSLTSNAQSEGRALVEPAPLGAPDEFIPGAPAKDTAVARDAIGAGEESADPSVASGSVSGIAAPTTGGSILAAPPIDAKIVRTASIELRTRRGSFEDAWSDTTAVASAFGGTVLSASRSGSGKGPRVGMITLRIPSARFDAAVERLRDTPHTSVRRLDVASQDVTQEYVDVRSRLRHDRAVEARLLALLAQTTGVGEVLAVQARLDQVQEQIEISTGRLTYLTTMTATSTIDVTLRDPGTKKADTAEKDDHSVLGEALSDARDRGSENIAAAIVWLGGALPTLVLLALLALVGRAAWRRTRG